MTQAVEAEQSRSSVDVADPDAWFVLGPTGDIGNGNDTELHGKRRLKSRRWRDGNVACANGGWRVAA